jgi:RNA polymerase sigma-70 factor (ECF subfamily)
MRGTARPQHAPHSPSSHAENRLHDNDVSDFDRRDNDVRVGAGAPGARPAHMIRTLYEQHHDSLVTAVVQFTGGDVRRAEAITRETLLRAWQRLPRLGAADVTIRPWLIAVARRLSMPGHLLEAEPPMVLRASPDTCRSLDVMAMADALRTLRPGHRRVLIETYFRGRTTDEAAVALGMRPHTVKSVLYDALRALREQLPPSQQIA